ncbi:MAG: hypothetical protein OEW27_13715, partial [Aquincola sp.]|nr:hypothetical protein [Aquincola sp.]
MEVILRAAAKEHAMRRILDGLLCATSVLVLSVAVLAVGSARAQVPGPQAQSPVRSTTDPGNRAAADKVIQAQREGMGWAAPVMPKDAKSRSDYQAGYEDGLNDTNRVEYRNNRPYGDGQRAGRAKRDALRSAPNGSDRLLGYRDGYNGRRSRDGDRRNRAYEDAYRAGHS